MDDAFDSPMQSTVKDADGILGVSFGIEKPIFCL